VRCALALHNHDLAQRYTTELWHHLHQQGTQGMEFPVRAYLTCVEAFAALGDDDQAHSATEAGYRELTARAVKISQAEWAYSFLYNIPEHRALLDLWEQIAP
ncbi:MAG TPA: hypothetical protein VLG46_00360, partial [Anaerolineae bacterium]|nr:hypothetical protein [Anaerolineae bacterium]